MEVQLTSLSKKFVSNTLFKGLNAHFKNDEVYAITGPNGSGKSTLLKIIAGYLAPSSGSVIYSNKNNIILKEDYYKHISICAPYLNLIEEFTLAEHIAFHQKFKDPLQNTDKNKIFETIDKAYLTNSLNKPIAEFSSGMQQRVKIILAVCFNSGLLLLDEPSSHLDKLGKTWYFELMKENINNRITLIFSNDEEEYINFTNNLINIESLK